MTALEKGAKQAPKLALTCFGVGDGWPCADRHHSSYLYRFDKQCLLIDCGEPISRSFKASGLDYNLIDHLFLSHLHFDHIGGFGMLMQGFWLEQRTKDLLVHAPSEGIAPLRLLLQLGCIFDELFQFKLEYEALTAARPIQCGNVRVTPFATHHLSQLKRSFESKYPQRYEAFSFLLESDEVRAGHSADIGAVEDLAPLLEAPLDLLVCELAHISPEELFRFLARKRIGRIVFIHLAREIIANFAEVEALAHKLLGADRVRWAKDGDEFTLDR